MTVSPKEGVQAGVGPRTTCSEDGWWDPVAFSLRQCWGVATGGAKPHLISAPLQGHLGAKGKDCP